MELTKHLTILSKMDAMTKMNLYWLREQVEEEPKEEAHP